MNWRLVTDDKFLDSTDELDDTDMTAAVIEMLVWRIMSMPHRTDTIGDTAMRAVSSNSGNGYPALKLFYTAEEGVVTLLRVERYVESPELLEAIEQLMAFKPTLR